MSKLQQALFPFQREDLGFLEAHPKCINGNPMGAGKTVEALALLEELGTKHNLIVTKRTLIPEWFWQIDQWLDGDCLTPHENGDRLIGLDLRSPRFVCINYDLLSNQHYWTQLTTVPWDAIVYDECHKLKNHLAKRTRSAYLLRSPRIIHMSGTPMQNSPADLYPLFHIMNPAQYRDYHWWINTFCVRTEEEIWVKGSDGKPRPRIIRNIVPGKSNHTEQLNQLLHLYMVRHEKHEIFKQLPPKQYHMIPIELGPERKQYEQMKEELFAMLDSGELITAPAVVAQLTRLRQICLDPNLLSKEPVKTATPSAKTQALFELLDDTDEKVLVYSFFEQYIRILCQELDRLKIKYVTITGKRTATENGIASRQFQDDPEVKVALGTIGSMGEGWTLTAAKIVVFTDLFWNPAVNEQAEDRAYGRANLGLEQTESTLIIDLFNQDTVEEHVHEVVRHKKELFNEVVVRRAVIDRMRQRERITV